MQPKKRFMLVGMAPKGTDDETVFRDFEELDLLVKTYGGEVFAATNQKSNHSYRATFIGTGKAQEITDKIAEEKIDIVVINDHLKPGQLFTLEKIFQRSNINIKVWDRVNLILNIFSLNANTKEAKLQIELANLKHMGPRTFGMGYILSRQGGGIGTVGVGETNTELMKRHWGNEIRQKLTILNKLSRERVKQIEKRKSLGFLTAALVGYTNAGKTLLFNRLTNKTNLVSAALFATLNSSVAKLYLPGIKKEIIISDTIGFIKNIPPSLIDAFKSTLLESVNADLLLHVIDLSDPEFRNKIRVVNEILRELCPQDIRQFFVFNKIDRVPSFNKQELKEKYGNFNPLIVSAKNGQGLDLLLASISSNILS